MHRWASQAMGFRTFFAELAGPSIAAAAAAGAEDLAAAAAAEALRRGDAEAAGMLKELQASQAFDVWCTEMAAGRLHAGVGSAIGCALAEHQPPASTAEADRLLSFAAGEPLEILDRSGVQSVTALLRKGTQVLTCVWSAARSRVCVCVRTGTDGWWLAAADRGGLTCRGWVPSSFVMLTGPVPD